MCVSSPRHVPAGDDLSVRRLTRQLTRTGFDEPRDKQNARPNTEAKKLPLTSSQQLLSILARCVSFPSCVSLTDALSIVFLINHICYVNISLVFMLCVVFPFLCVLFHIFSSLLDMFQDNVAAYLDSLDNHWHSLWSFLLLFEIRMILKRLTGLSKIFHGISKVVLT